jgi:fucose permease
VLLSVLMPHLRGFEDRQIGALFGAQFIGQLLGPFFVSKRPRRTLVIGLMGTIATCIVMAFGSGPYIPILGMYGAALGLTMASTNTVMAVESPKQLRGSRVQILNVFWPLGAACAPLFLSLESSPGWHIFLIAACTSLISLIPAFISSADSEYACNVSAENISLAPIQAVALAWMCLVTALAGSIEFTIASWAPSLAYRSLGSLRAASAASVWFWSGILCSRFVASYGLRRIPWERLACASALLGVIGTVILARGGQRWILPSIFLSAAGIAPVYPVIIASSVQMRGKNLIFVCAGIGGAFLPWLIGRISGLIGTLREDMFFVCAAFVLLAVLLLQASRRPTVA